ncbi:hypothetical protein EZV62_024105 [Acer yangbiense]|uniref:Uncharacterized protein n=1 Tax=Acer yangbiense TaxID=1000413 RepID=A0A5C7H3U0_9ROSI|nr:hypothetical protein EZV62_024105 [Acer yangbiense]
MPYCQSDRHVAKPSGFKDEADIYACMAIESVYDLLLCGVMGPEEIAKLCANLNLLETEGQECCRPNPDPVGRPWSFDGALIVLEEPTRDIGVVLDGMVGIVKDVDVGESGECLGPSNVGVYRMTGADNNEGFNVINDDMSDSRDGGNDLNGFTFQCKKRESLLPSGGPKIHEGEVIMGRSLTKLDHLSGPIGIQMSRRNNDLSDFNIKRNGHGQDIFHGSKIRGTPWDLLENEGGLTVRGRGRWKRRARNVATVRTGAKLTEDGLVKGAGSSTKHGEFDARSVL